MQLKLFVLSSFVAAIKLIIASNLPFQPLKLDSVTRKMNHKKSSEFSESNDSNNTTLNDNSDIYDSFLNDESLNFDAKLKVLELKQKNQELKQKTKEAEETRMQKAKEAEENRKLVRSLGVLICVVFFSVGTGFSNEATAITKKFIVDEVSPLLRAMMKRIEEVSLLIKICSVGAGVNAVGFAAYFIKKVFFKG